MGPLVKWQGRGGKHPPSSAQVKERVELHPYSLSGPSWLPLRRIIFLGKDYKPQIKTNFLTFFTVRHKVSKSTHDKVFTRQTV
jgi:hypothetical protein